MCPWATVWISTKYQPEPDTLRSAARRNGGPKRTYRTVPVAAATGPTIRGAGNGRFREGRQLHASRTQRHGQSPSLRLTTSILITLFSKLYEVQLPVSNSICSTIKYLFYRYFLCLSSKWLTSAAFRGRRQPQRWSCQTKIAVGAGG